MPWSVDVKTRGTKGNDNAACAAGFVCVLGVSIDSVTDEGGVGIQLLTLVLTKGEFRYLVFVLMMLCAAEFDSWHLQC